ncbi:MAG: hypothetical protein ACM3ZO_10430, partial [Clostridia bacterium]
SSHSGTSWYQNGRSGNCAPPKWGNFVIVPWGNYVIVGWGNYLIAWWGNYLAPLRLTWGNYLNVDIPTSSVRMEAHLLKNPHGLSDALGMPRVRSTGGCERDVIGLNLL